MDDELRVAQPDLGAPVVGMTLADMSNGVAAELGAVGFEDAREVGRGGFGVVFRCTQVGLDRVVAVKVLTAQLADDRARFVREQHAMARLTGHPNIVAVLQVGQTKSGWPFLVMPFCAPGCWQQRIVQCGPLPPDEVLRLGVKIAGALDAAHRVGIVHRDVKPANILLTDYGEPALCDFGIARTGTGFKTTTGVFVGSPAFTAPELLGGEAPSPASDVYALGASLFVGLTGHAAFEWRVDEQLMAQFVRIAREPVPDLRQQDIPEDVTAVIEQTMARDPTQRPSAQELGQRLQQLQACYGLPVDGMAVHGAEVAGRRPVRPGAAVSGRGSSAGGKIPALSAAIVGRDAELAQLRQLLTQSRLVTLTGTGGLGKTTLATYAAHQLGTDFADGVWMVELADLHDGGLLTQVVAAALDIRDQAGRPPSESIVDVFGQRQALVVLDNCEHVIDDAAKLVDILLRDCPELHILATSREILDIGGETVFALTPLGCPAPDDHLTVGALASYTAVDLFIQRASAAVPGFTLTADNAAAVAHICARLDGLPLAIELAAARLRALSVAQIADALADRYTLLTRGRRGAPTRQQTLTACIDWSYQLCTHVERHLWTQLSIFAGSFNLDAVQAIFTDSPTISGTTAHDAAVDNPYVEQCLDLLCALVDKSILIRTQRDGEVRFRLLETLRDYGRARLTDTEHPLLAGRHARYYQRLLIRASAEWCSPRQIQWLQQLSQEMPNFREALRFSLVDSPERALWMVAGMRGMWLIYGMVGEGRRWLDLALNAAAPDPTPQRILALAATVQIAVACNDLALADSRILVARRLVEMVDFPGARGLIDFLDSVSRGLMGGDIEYGLESCQRALAATDAFEVQVEATLVAGWLHQSAGDVHQARGCFEKALALVESLGEAVSRGHALTAMGVCCWQLGEQQRAQDLLRMGLRLSRTINNVWDGTQMLEMLAWTRETDNDVRGAVLLMSAASAMARACGSTAPMFVYIGGFHAECERRAREELGPAEFDKVWNHGMTLTFDEAARLALGETDIEVFLPEPA